MPSDDCYFLAPDRLVTTDSLAEGTHFRNDWSTPEDLAWKLVEVNVSDIISSGGIPDLAFLNFGFPKKNSISELWLQRFQTAFRQRLKIHKIQLAGGDTFLSPFLSLNLTLFGKVKTPILRSGAKPNDTIYISGALGGSEAGLRLLQKKTKQMKPWQKKQILRHLRPRSRRDLSPILSKFEISSCMDITDGLVQDARKLAEASGVSLEIEIEKIPAEKNVLDLLGWNGILASGEELELLFTSPREISKDIQVFAIGKVKPYLKKNPVMFTLRGKKFIPSQIGYLHFK